LNGLDVGARRHGVGTTAAQAVLDFRHHDGANQLGDEPGGTAGVTYTGYRRSTPGTGSTTRSGGTAVPAPPPAGAAECTGRMQTYLTPFWDRVAPFALTSPSQFRVPGPYTYLRADGKPSGKYATRSTR
jgi:hypothetical protein